MVGLGNPGDRYTGTRHNVGFEVVDLLAGKCGVRVDRLDCRSLTARARLGATPVVLAKPQTYMNLSGESVKGLVAKLDVPLERLLVVSDDVALPVGRLRIRPSGSSGGQKGLQSVIECLKSEAFPRLRLGVAGPHYQRGEELADYVLSRFAKAERPLIDGALGAGVDAVECWALDGIDAAMNRFNRSPETVPAG